MKKKIKINVFSTIVFIAFTLFTLSLFVLLSWWLLASLKDYYTDFISNKLGLPKVWSFNNYVTVFNNYVVEVNDKFGSKQTINIVGQLFNTIVICGLSAFLLSFVPCWTGYLVAKYNYFFSKLMYSVALIAMALPIIGAYPSELDLLSKLGIYNSFLTIVFQRSGYLGVYFFVYVACFKSISNDFYDAATLDGASEIKVFFKVMFPMAINTFFTIFLLVFVANWNDYQYALLYLPSKPTLAYGLFRFFESPLQHLNNAPTALAACFFLMIPILIVFIIFKDRLMNNLSMGGLKE